MTMLLPFRVVSVEHCTGIAALSKYSWVEFGDLVKFYDCCVLYSRVCLSHIYSLIYSSTYLAVLERLLCARR